MDLRCHRKSDWLIWKKGTRSQVSKPSPLCMPCKTKLGPNWSPYEVRETALRSDHKSRISVPPFYIVSLALQRIPKQRVVWKRKSRRHVLVLDDPKLETEVDSPWKCAKFNPVQLITHVTCTRPLFFGAGPVPRRSGSYRPNRRCLCAEHLQSVNLFADERCFPTNAPRKESPEPLGKVT